MQAIESVCRCRGGCTESDAKTRGVASLDDLVTPQFQLLHFSRTWAWTIRSSGCRRELLATSSTPDSQLAFQILALRHRVVDSSNEVRKPGTRSSKRSTRPRPPSSKIAYLLAVWKSFGDIDTSFGEKRRYALTFGVVVGCEVEDSLFECSGVVRISSGVEQFGHQISPAML